MQKLQIFEGPARLGELARPGEINMCLAWTGQTNDNNADFCQNRTVTWVLQTSRKGEILESGAALQESKDLGNRQA